MGTIKRILKNGPLGNIVTKVADFYSDPSSLFLIKKLRDNNANKVILIGTPCHHNLGDHLIAENEVHFLKERCHVETVIEIPTRIFMHNISKIKKAVAANIPILITGGGWMGDVWPEDEEIIETIINAFSKNTVIIFPQTVYYENIENSKPLIEKTKQVLKNASSITLMCRDQQSFNVSNSLFKDTGIQILLFPDIGLYRAPIDNSKTSNVIRCCLRDDREAISDKTIRRVVNKIAIDNKYAIIDDSTIAKKAVGIWKRKKNLTDLIRRFSDSEIVITDRLHGMIFAVLAGTKCVALDNMTHKVAGVYSLWLKNNPNVALIKKYDKQTFCNVIKSKLEEQNNNGSYYHQLESYFEQMSICIIKLIRSAEIRKEL